MDKVYEYKGIKYSSIRRLAQELGVSWKIVRRCISNVNEHKNLEQAIYERLNNPPISMGIPVEYKGVRYSSIAKLSEKLKVGAITLTKWIRMEGNIEENIDKGLAGGFKGLKDKYKGRPKPVEYDGVLYGSMKELAEMLMVSPTTLSEWKKIGDDLTETIKEKIKNRIDVKYNGKKYIDKSTLARDLGASVYWVSRWIKEEGDTTDNIDKGLFELRKRITKVEYNGVIYPNITRLSIALGVSKQVVHSWVHLDGDISTNIDNGMKRLRRPKKILYNGVEYNTAKALAKKLNVSSSSVSKWARMEGDVTENIDKGLVKVCESKGKKVEYNGIQYKSMKDLSQFLNVSPGTVSKWTRMDGDITENINKGLAKLCDINGKEIEYNGIQYKSIEELASLLNMHIGAVSKWLRARGDVTENINRYLELRAKK